MMFMRSNKYKENIDLTRAHVAKPRGGTCKRRTRREARKSNKSVQIDKCNAMPS
jgi:hypothetical protein